MAISPTKFISQVKQEGKRVTWPTRKETIGSTGIVIVIVIIASTFFLIADWVISSLIQWFLGL